MSGLSQATVTAINEAQYRTLIRRAIDDLMEPADLTQLKRLLFEVEQLELIEKPEPVVVGKPRYRITRHRRGVVYDPEYRASLEGAEKRALTYFNGVYCSVPHLVYIEATNDPAGRRLFGCGAPLPKWRHVLTLQQFEVRFRKQRGVVGTCYIAAAEASTARKRAEAKLGIGYTVLSVKEVK